MAKQRQNGAECQLNASVLKLRYQLRWAEIRLWFRFFVLSAAVLVLLLETSTSSYEHEHYFIEYA